MATDHLLNAQFHDTIAVALLSSISSEQVPTFGTAATRKARVHPQCDVITNARGEEVTTSTELKFAHVSGDTVDKFLTARFWLPDDAISQTVAKARTAQAVTYFDDVAGNIHHWRVLL